LREARVDRVARRGELTAGPSAYSTHETGRNRE